MEGIDKILIIVEYKGNAHQVLASKDNKELVLQMLSSLENGLKLDKELEPYELKYNK